MFGIVRSLKSVEWYQCAFRRMKSGEKSRHMAREQTDLRREKVLRQLHIPLYKFVRSTGEHEVYERMASSQHAMSYKACAERLLRWLTESASL